MKNLKKVLALLACLVIIVQITPIAAAEEDTVYVMIQVKLDRNIIKAKYGVTVCVDGVQVYHLRQGEQTTFGAVLTKGKHVISFVADKEKAGTQNWYLGGLIDHTAISCELKTHGKYVEIRKSNVTVPTGEALEYEKKTNAKLEVGGKLIKIVWDLP